METIKKLTNAGTRPLSGQLVIFDEVYDNQTLMQAKTQIERKPEEEPSVYRPLPSVWDGEDSELLERLLSFYPRKEPKRILDATVNGGRFWKGSEREVIGMDLAFSHRPSLVGDNTLMPFADSVFDVIVYDPPHIPNQGKDKQKDFNTRFGLGQRSPKEHGYSFSHLYPPFMSEAYRLLIPKASYSARSQITYTTTSINGHTLN